MVNAVDVRDVAQAHLLALTAAEVRREENASTNTKLTIQAANKRFLLTGKGHWTGDWARHMRYELPRKGVGTLNIRVDEGPSAPWRHLFCCFINEVAPPNIRFDKTQARTCTNYHPTVLNRCANC